MTTSSILHLALLSFWLLSFVLWIMSTYHRNHNVQIYDLTLIQKLIPYKRRSLFKNSRGFVYYTLAYSLFLAGILCNIISSIFGL